MFYQDKINKILEATEANTNNAPDKIELEKNDMAALLVAGFATLLPALLIVLAMILGVFWFFAR